MAPSTSIRLKMKYLDEAKVMTVASKEDSCLSSMKNFINLIYENFPEVKEKCEKNCAWRSFKLYIQWEDEDGDLVSISNDGELKSVLECTANKLKILIKAKKQDPADGSGQLNRGLNSHASSSSRSKLREGHVTTAKETRGKEPCRHFNFGNGHCRRGSDCHYAHVHHRNGGARGSSEHPIARDPSRVAPVNFGSWLKHQYAREPIDNITFLSKDNGLEVLGKIVEQKNLPATCIDILVKLLAREEFRLSLMRENTNKVFALLIGSSFLLQLHKHITSQLLTAPAEEIMPYLLLIEELQSRTTDGWQEVPLDTINNVIQKLNESSAKTELLMMVNRLIDHRNKLQRQATLAPTDGNKFLGEEFRSISIVPDKSELLQPQMGSDLPVNLVGQRYTSTVNYLETHFRLLREDCIDPLRQGIKSYRNNESSRELRIYRQVRLAGFRCGIEGLEYVLSFQVDRRTNMEASKRLLFGALVCLSFDGFQESFIFGVVTGNDFKNNTGAGNYTVWIRVMKRSEVRNGETEIEESRTYVMVESSTAYFEAYYHVLRSLQREDMKNIPFTKYLLDLEQQVDPPFYLQRRVEGDEFDFRDVFPSMKADLGKSLIHVLQDWPHWTTTLDKAQLQALKHGLTKELAIIQGPPGTGKTFLGLLVVRLLLANYKPRPPENLFQGGSSIGPPFFGRNKVRLNAPADNYGRKGPILVICMTNHALDQFLEGIYKFEKNIIRVGSRSKNSVLQGRNLKTLLEQEKHNHNGLVSGHRHEKGVAYYEKNMLEEQIADCIKKSNAVLVKVAELTDIATEAQIRSLLSVGLKPKETLSCWLAGDMFPRLDVGDQQFYKEEISDSDSDAEIELEGKKKRSGQVIMLRRSRDSDHGGTEYEGWRVQGRRRNRHRRAAEARQQLRDTNADVIPAGGEVMMDEHHQLIAEVEAMGIEDNPGDLQEDPENNNEVELQIQDFVDFPDVWLLNEEQRRMLHDYWLDELRMRYRREQQELATEYQRSCKVVREIDDEMNLSILRKANVVGITTTAAARFRDILQALNSEILVVEEAAEVLEAHILAGLSNCVKHLVLIGDHLQLRPSTAVYKLGTKHKLDVSMFERLLEGGVEHVTLQEQRRMRPSFSKLVRSLYPELKDHESVCFYEDISGVNSNLMFFDHTAEENSTSVDSSKVNTTEAKLVVELTLYLLKQGYSAGNIGILTMYSGQIVEIKRIMKDRAPCTLAPKYFQRMRTMQKDDNHGQEEEQVTGMEQNDDLAKLLPRVSSVDDFQGEEADIIILSLVRSNDIQTGEGEGTIGFLKTSNRICVALTRAKKGMFIFGNATLLAKRSSLWNKVVSTLRKDNALDTKLELVCQNHPETKTVITKEEDFKQVVDGGCSRPCEVQLDCGHVCSRRCHPGSHDDVICPKPCLRKYSDCQHTCAQRCHGSSNCLPCGAQVVKIIPTCGHSQRMKCCKDPGEETCQTPCPKKLKCLHKCSRVCGVPCTVICGRRVFRDLPCGHKTWLPCHEDPRLYSCGYPCGAVNSYCGHPCQGTCSLCKEGKDHIPCLQKCGRILPCGHACEYGCSAPCPPCKKKCQKRCFHSKCQFACGQICVPCREPCPWRCEHHKCELLCHEMCTRPRCDRPCKKVLACSHPCIGLCGEPCPTKCRICHRTTIEIITQMTLEEFEDTDRFHQLQDCKHLFEVSGLDTWMDSDDNQADDGRRSAAVKLKECPQCKMPVWRSTRYANVVKSRQEKLEGVKKKMFGYDMTRKGQLKLQNGEYGEAYELFVQALKQNPTLLEAHFGAGSARYSSKNYEQSTVFLSFVVGKSSYAAEVRSVLKETVSLDEEFGTSKVDCRPNEELAVKAMLQLASAFTALQAFTEAEKLCDTVISTHPDNKDAKSIKERANNGLIAVVIQAMSQEVGGKGHWYQCPKGHFYVIGECGGAMQLSKCPDCKADVGGGQHRLTAGNSHADIDGSSGPAWPGGGL